MITLGDSSGSNAATLMNLGTTSLTNKISLGGTTGALTIASYGIVSNQPFTLTGGVDLNGRDVQFINNVTNAGTTNLTESGAINGTGSVTVTTNSTSATLMSGGFNQIGNLNLVSAAGGTTSVTGTVNNTGIVTHSGAGTGATTISSQIKTNVTGVVQNSLTSALILSNANTYNGPTTINAGTLLVTSNGGTGTGLVTVNSTGILGGTGTITPSTTLGSGQVIVNSGGAIAPGLAGSIGTLNFTGAAVTGNVVTLASGAKLNFDLGASSTSDKIVFFSYVSGDLSLSANAFNFSGTQAGTYTLFQFYSSSNTSTAASVNFQSSDFDLAGSTGLDGYTATLDFTTVGQINLIVAAAVPEPATWVLLLASALFVAVASRRRLLACGTVRG